MTYTVSVHLKYLLPPIIFLTSSSLRFSWTMGWMRGKGQVWSPSSHFSFLFWCLAVKSVSFFTPCFSFLYFSSFFYACLFLTLKSRLKRVVPTSRSRWERKLESSFYLSPPPSSSSSSSLALTLTRHKNPNRFLFPLPLTSSSRLLLFPVFLRKRNFFLQIPNFSFSRRARKRSLCY